MAGDQLPSECTGDVPFELTVLIGIMNKTELTWRGSCSCFGRKGKIHLLKLFRLGACSKMSMRDGLDSDSCVFPMNVCVKQ